MPLLIKVNGKITFAQILVGYLGLFLIGARRARDRHVRQRARPATSWSLAWSAP